MFRIPAILIAIVTCSPWALHAASLFHDGQSQQPRLADHSHPLLELSTLAIILLALLIIGFVLHANNRLQREIAQRRKIEQQLQDKSNSLLESQEIAHVGTWEWNIVTGALIWSDEIYRIFGLTPQQFEATYEAFLHQVHPDDRERVINAVNDAVQHDMRYDIEHRLLRPDGETRVVKESGRIYRDAAGKPLRMLGVVHDITPLKKIEDNLRQERDTAQKYLDIAGVIFLIVDAHEHIALINHHGAAVLGYEDDSELLGLNWFDTFVPAKDRDALRKVFQVLLDGKDHSFDRHTNPLITRQHEERWITWQNIPLRDESGRIYAILSSGSDITEQRHIEEKLRLSDKVFEYSSEALLITDHNNHIVTANPGFTEQTGYTLEEVLGKDPRILSSGRHDREFYRKMWTTLADKGHWAGEVWDRRKDGSIYPKWLSINAVTDPASGELTHYIAIFADISQRKAAEERIRHMAHHDALTDLPNRLLLQDRLEQAIAKARRNGQQAALLFIDLDRFKTINDSLGHHIGDLLLQEIAYRLTQCVRESDTVARLGGDEFVIVLESILRPGDIHRVADSVIEAVSLPVLVEGHELYITPSIGISITPVDGENVDILMRNADTAMYQAKRLGGSNYQFFAPHMNEAAHERLELEHSLRRAVENNEFELHYQPIIDIRNNRLYGAEVLLRWQHPRNGYVSPDRFIPIAEETNLILPLGEWVLQNAIRQLGQWHHFANDGMVLCINLSTRQFRQAGLIESLARLMAQENIPPRMLELEITESTLMENPQETVALMQRISDMGIVLSVDDFGTGYSSLSYLKHLPISKLKIDRSFVRDIPYNSDDATVASAIISLAHALNLKVVAEGVETVEQLDFFTQAGCHAVQGFYFSKPLSAEDFVEFRQTFAARNQTVTTDAANTL